MSATFSQGSDTAVPIRIVDTEGLSALKASLGAPDQTWLEGQGFAAKLGQFVLLPASDGSVGSVLAGRGNASARERGRFHLADLATRLPNGVYSLSDDTDPEIAEELALGWLLQSYRFDRYKKAGSAAAGLVAPAGVDAGRLETIAAGATLACDLINTPASDMGPDALETAVRDLAGAFGAEINVTTGADLLEKNLPMIHAVGRASDQAPRLLDLRWGHAAGPKVTLVGKGVCFDTGGLNIKPGRSMGLMKKDMGGAANVLGLARMIMSSNLPVQLRVLVPAVENSISAGAFRPQDVLTSRKGLSVEINNTDAEGRLVLADALTLGDEETPDLMICMATLTGAARVALGPDLPPYFTDQQGLASDLEASAQRVSDPLWRLPFWNPYEKMIEPDIADLDNAPSGGFAGAITAALFLRRFVENAAEFAHFDIYGWTPSALPARPKGGACQGARAIFDMISHRYGGTGDAA